MRTFIRVCIGAAAAVSLGFTWVVAQTGLEQTNRNLCDLWAHLPLPTYQSCEFQNVLVYAGMTVTAIIVCWLLAELYLLAPVKRKVDTVLKISVARLKMLQPIHLIIFGTAIVAIGVCWQIYAGNAVAKTAAPTSEQISAITAPLQAQIDSLKRQLANAGKTVIANIPQTNSNATIDGSLPLPPKRYTAYEKEQRLRSVDEMYKALSTQLYPLQSEGQYLFNHLLDGVGDGTTDKKLNAHAENVDAAFANFVALTKQYEYFPDIVQIPRQRPVFNAIEESNAARNLIGTIAFLKANVQPAAFSKALDRDVTLLEARTANGNFEQFLQRTMPQLQQKRIEIEKVEAYSDK